MSCRSIGACWPSFLSHNEDANQSALVLVEHRLNYGKDFVNDFPARTKVLAEH